jgi:hypothetical protein
MLKESLRIMTKKEKQKKIAKVMREFKGGKLKSSSGDPVKSPQQALAIALSEAGMTRKPKKDMSDEYYMGFFKELIGEEEEEEGEEMEMDESAGEARCRGYLKKVASNKKKA